MTDLVERLHYSAEYHIPGASIANPDLLREAAAEIERLRGLLKRETDYREAWFNSAVENKEEIERLRAELKKAKEA